MSTPRPAAIGSSGRVLSGEAMHEHAKKNGLCEICGETKTHVKVKAGRFNLRSEWMPVTSLDGDGNYEVFNGHCIGPICHKLSDAQKKVKHKKHKKKKKHTERKTSNPPGHKHDENSIETEDTMPSMEDEVMDCISWLPRKSVEGWVSKKPTATTPTIKEDEVSPAVSPKSDRVMPPDTIEEEEEDEDEKTPQDISAQIDEDGFITAHTNESNSDSASSLEVHPSKVLSALFGDPCFHGKHVTVHMDSQEMDEDEDEMHREEEDGTAESKQEHCQNRQQLPVPNDVVPGEEEEEQVSVLDDSIASQDMEVPLVPVLDHRSSSLVTGNATCDEEEQLSILSSFETPEEEDTGEMAAAVIPAKACSEEIDAEAAGGPPEIGATNRDVCRENETVAVAPAAPLAFASGAKNKENKSFPDTSKPSSAKNRYRQALTSTLPTIRGRRKVLRGSPLTVPQVGEEPLAVKKEVTGTPISPSPSESNTPDAAKETMSPTAGQPPSPVAQPDRPEEHEQQPGSVQAAEMGFLVTLTPVKAGMIHERAAVVGVTPPALTPSTSSMDSKTSDADDRSAPITSLPQAPAVHPNKPEQEGKPSLKPDSPGKENRHHEEVAAVVLATPVTPPKSPPYKSSEWNLPVSVASKNSEFRNLPRSGTRVVAGGTPPKSPPYKSSEWNLPVSVASKNSEFRNLPRSGTRVVAGGTPRSQNFRSVRTFNVKDDNGVGDRRNNNIKSSSVPNLHRPIIPRNTNQTREDAYVPHHPNNVSHDSSFYSRATDRVSNRTGDRVSVANHSRNVSATSSLSLSSSTSSPQDEALRHAQRSGLLWQTLLGQHVRFPKTWWNGARSPGMGVKNFVTRTGENLPKHLWKYTALEYVYGNPVLEDIVPHRESPGRLLLHIVVRDESCRPVEDIAIGCYHPNAPALPKVRKALGHHDCRALWMGVRRRSGQRPGSGSMVEPLLAGGYGISAGGCSISDAELDSPLGKGRRVRNNHLMTLFGDQPPLETIFMLEDDLVKKIMHAQERESTYLSTEIALLLLEMFLTWRVEL